MTSLDKSVFLKIVKVLLGIKIVVGFIYCFGPLMHPHITRQSDTLGVILQFWLRWSHSSGFSWDVLFPAAINAGETNGIIGMEFPILYWISALGYSAGLEWGRSLARLIFYVLTLAAFFLSYRSWRGKTVGLVSMGEAILLLGLLSVSMLYFTRLIPDPPSFFLALTAVGLSFERPKFLSSFTLLLLALLIKPTSIIVAFLFILSPRDNWTRQLMWLIPSTLIAYCYYKLGVPYLNNISDMEPFFRTRLRDPITLFAEVISDPKGVWTLLNRSLFPPLVFVLLLLYSVRALSGGAANFGKILGVLVVQMLFIFLLNGSHNFKHDYYLMGVSVSASVLFLSVFYHSKSVLFRWVLLLATVGYFVDKTSYEVSFLWNNKSEIAAQWADCERLKKSTPELPWGEHYKFRSPERKRSEFGVCFSEVQSAKHSEWGFFKLDQSIPEQCETHKAGDRFRLVRCRTH